MNISLNPYANLLTQYLDSPVVRHQGGFFLTVEGPMVIHLIHDQNTALIFYTDMERIEVQTYDDDCTWKMLLYTVYGGLDGVSLVTLMNDACPLNIRLEVG